MFENIDKSVNVELANQGTPTPATAPMEPTVANAERVQLPPEPSALDLANAEIARLRSEAETAAAQHEVALASLKAKSIIDSAMRPPTAKINRGEQDAAITKVVNRIGNCRWHALSPQQRCESIGIYGSEQVTDKALRQYFGSDTSAAATQLQRTNTAEYARLRGIARCRGIL
jgi:hypothetical protein